MESRRSAWRAGILVFAAAAVAAILTVLVAREIFPDGSPNLDEIAYDAQARALLDGELTLPREIHEPFFRPFLSGLRDDRVVFKYQPAWPAVLAASRGALGTTLPLRAFLAAAAVVSTYAFARELLRSRKIAVTAAAVIALSPFVWLQAATLLGYQLSFVLGLASAAAFVRAIRIRGKAAAFVGGALFGFAAFHRPYDALIATVPVLVYAVFELRRRGALATLAGWALLGALPAGLLIALYNWAVMGAPWRMPFGVSGSIDTFGFGWRASFGEPSASHAGQVHYTIGIAWHATSTALQTLPRFVFAAPVVIGLAIYAFARKWRDARAVLLVGMIAAIVVAYFFWWGVENAIRFHLEDSLGPFYHYSVLGPLAVLAAWGAWSLRPTPLLVSALAVIAAAWTIPMTWNVLDDARDAGRVREAEIALTEAPGRRLVLQDPRFPGDPYVRIANDADLGGERVVGVAIPGRRLAVVEQFPDRDALLVVGMHRAGDVFGPTIEERRQLEVIEDNRVVITMSGSPAADRPAVTYLRIDDEVQEQSGVDATWELGPRDLPEEIVTVAAGYRYSPEEFVECRFEGRRSSATQIRILTPCDGYAGYGFPDGSTAVVREDISGRLTVTATPG